MKRTHTVAALAALALAVSGPALAQSKPPALPAGNLNIYWIDTEGGAATLLVSPSGESLLIDTGYPDGDRDAKRINAAARQAGLTKIDYLVISHWHADHVGGLAALAKMIPIGRFFDHGDGVEPENQQRLDGYKAVAGDKRTIVKPGDRIPVKGFDALVKRAEGKLTLLNNQVDATTGMVTLKATFANDDEVLWPGAFVNAHLILETVKNGVTVPSAAVQMGPKGAFAYLIKDNSTVAAQPLTVTQIEANTALIGEGLKDGDKVVVSGQNGLFPGAKVAVQEGAPGQMNAQDPEIGPEGVGSTGVNTPAPGGAGINPR